MASSEWPPQLPEVVVRADAGHAQHLAPRRAPPRAPSAPPAPRRRSAAGPAPPAREGRGGPPCRARSAAARPAATMRGGDQYPGSRSRSQRRSAGRVHRPPTRGTAYATSRVPGAVELARHHGGLRHGGVLGQHGLHLARLHAEARRTFTWSSTRPRNSSSPSAPQPARGRPCGTSAPPARRERVGNKALRRERRPPQVAAGHARARPGTARPPRPRRRGAGPRRARTPAPSASARPMGTSPATVARRLAGRWR